MNRVTFLVGLGMLTLALGCAPGPRSAGRPGARVAAPAARPAGAAPLAFPGSVATALDPVRGVPRLLRATTRQLAPAGAAAAEAARTHLERHAPAYGVAAADLAGAEVQAVHDPGRGGVVVSFRQRAHGVEVYRGEVKVLMRRSLELVAISGAPVATPAAPLPFVRSPRAAVAAALGAHLRVPLAVDGVAPLGPAPGGFERVDLARPVAVGGGTASLSRPARVKPVLFPDRGVLVPAHFVELVITRVGSVAAEAFRYVIADDDGRVLERRDLTRDAHRYRVWADAAGRPLDGPQADYTPHPAGYPDRSRPAFVPSSLVELAAFNRNPAGQPDPWLAAGATETRGNNVDAYVDLQAPDGFGAGDFRAATTSADTFDHGYDVTLAPDASQTQRMAAITQVFYVINWLHDWFYDSGFDEAAGNAQQSNYGRGGLGGDRILAEVQDHGGRNNANMSTLFDGASPTMQLFLWTGPDQVRTLHVTPPGADLATGAAEFGPRDFDVTGAVALAADGTAPVNDACEAIVTNVAGRVALVDRGTCEFKDKAINAQAKGAIAVILANNQGGGPIAMPDGSATAAVTIPVLSVSQSDGAALKAALQSGTVTAHLARAGGVDLEGGLESTLVAHEWGHYFHFRLADCSQGYGLCGAMSEGWGDFVALHLALREGDDLDGTFAASGIYVGAGTELDSAYFGGRRVAYSVDFSKNSLTFRHIADGEPLPTDIPLWDLGYPNSEVHCAGEIWATMLFEAYVALLQETQAPGATRTFDDARRVMSDYVVASLKMTPADATYLEARDALLAVAAAASEPDQVLLAEAFARRGAGSCADSPPGDSTDFSGVVESYVVSPRPALGAPTLDDSLASCDGNGRLDAGERGLLTVEVANASSTPLAGATLTLTAADPAVTFPNGPGASVGALPAFGATTVTVEVALDVFASALERVEIEVAVAAAEACNSPATRAAAFHVNFEERPAAATDDDVEASTTAWTPVWDTPAATWARLALEDGNHLWHGADPGYKADTWLQSPPLQVSASGRLVVSFRHRHDFEGVYDTEEPFACDWGPADGPAHCDGAVIEVSTDSGRTWADVSTWADPGYGGTIDPSTGNVLGERQAYVYRNAAWPEMEPVRLDLGTALAGRTVLLRFRVGTDAGGSALGWDIDDVAIEGIDNLPFALLANRLTACPIPQVDAGAEAGSPWDGRDIATCGGCAASPRPAAALVALLAVAALLTSRRERRGR